MSTENLDVKYPIFLLNVHNFVKKVVMDAHSKVMHGGAASTMRHIRERY